MRMANEDPDPKERAWAAGRLREEMAGEQGPPLDDPRRQQLQGKLEEGREKLRKLQGDPPPLDERTRQLGDFVTTAARQGATIPFEAQVHMFGTPEEKEDLHRAQAGIVGGTVAGLGAGAVLGPLAARAGGGALGLLARTGAAAGEGAASGAGARAAQGDGLAEVVDPANVGLDMAMGSGGGLAAEGFSALVGLIRKNPWIARYLDAKKLGRLDASEMKGFRGGEEGIHDAAEAGKDRILTRDAAMAEAESEAYRAGEDALPALDELEHIPQVHGALDRAVKHYQGSGRPISPDVANFIDEVKANLSSPVQQRLTPVMESDVQTNVRRVTDRTDGGFVTKSHFEPDPSRAGDVRVGHRPGEVVRGPAATRRDLIEQRRAVKKQAYGTPGDTSARTVAARDVYGSVDEAAKAAVPGLKDIDKRYRDFQVKRQRRSDILTSDPKALDTKVVDDVEEFAAPMRDRLRAGTEQRITTNLKRIGDTNQPGLRVERDLAELRLQDPEFDKALQLIEDKKALEAIRFRPRSSLPESLTGATALAGKYPLLAQNSRALALRSLPGLEGAGLLADALRFSAPTVNVLTAAARREAERKKKASENLKRAGKK